MKFLSMRLFIYFCISNSDLDINKPIWYMYTLFMYLYKKYRCDKKDKNHDINNKISILVSIIRILIFFEIRTTLIGSIIKRSVPSLLFFYTTILCHSPNVTW